ncbi:UNVERIFIED_CONTAM: hypothetical protein FKN15_029117 [Acipenser sinensis]
MHVYIIWSKQTFKMYDHLERHGHLEDKLHQHKENNSNLQITCSSTVKSVNASKPLPSHWLPEHLTSLTSSNKLYWSFISDKHIVNNVMGNEDTGFVRPYYLLVTGGP